jgi:DNA-binding MarR family transcriptional regulator
MKVQTSPLRSPWRAPAAQTAPGEEVVILQSLRRIIRAVELHSRGLLSRHGITGPRLACLTLLCNDGPMTSADLSRQLYVSASTVTGIVDRLESAGLVERRRDGEDRRCVYVRATRKGRLLASQTPSSLQDRLAERLRRVPARERAGIRTALERVVEMMEARDLDAAPILTPGSVLDEPTARVARSKP